MSLAVLILGICSIVFAGFPGLICAIIGLVLYKKALAKDGLNTQNKVGKILSIIGLILSILSSIGCVACTVITTIAGVAEAGMYY